jgi:hypothetical protein
MVRPALSCGFGQTLPPAARRPFAAIFLPGSRFFAAFKRRSAVFEKIFIIFKNRLTISRPHGKIIGVGSLK